MRMSCHDGVYPPPHARKLLDSTGPCRRPCSGDDLRATGNREQSNFITAFRCRFARAAMTVHRHNDACNGCGALGRQPARASASTSPDPAVRVWPTLSSSDGRSASVTRRRRRRSQLWRLRSKAAGCEGGLLSPLRRGRPPNKRVSHPGLDGQVVNTAPTQIAIATIPAANSSAIPLPMLTTTRLVDAHAGGCEPNRNRSPT